MPVTLEPTAVLNTSPSLLTKNKNEIYCPAPLVKSNYFLGLFKNLNYTPHTRW